jgi:hypothetical protein
MSFSHGGCSVFVTVRLERDGVLDGLFQQRR